MAPLLLAEFSTSYVEGIRQWQIGWLCSIKMSSMDLPTYLHDTILQLAYFPEKGQLRVAQTHFYAGLAGAYILDLMTLGRIELSDKRLYLLSAEPTDRPVLNEVLNRFETYSGKRKRPPRMTAFMHILIQRSGKLTPLARQTLIDGRILRKETKKVLWVIPWSTYPATNPNQTRQLQSAIRRRLDAPVDQFTDHDWMLAGLLQASNILPAVYDSRKEARAIGKQLKKDLKERGGAYAAVRDAVTQMQVVIASSTNAAVFQ